MKNKILLAGAVAIMSIVGMAGCAPTSNPTTEPSVSEPTTIPTTSPTTTPDPTTSNPFVEPNEGEKVNSDFEYARTTYVDKDGVEQPLTRNTLYTNSNDPHLDSTQPQRVLVIPVGFNNINYAEVQTKEKIKQIERTFFATDEEMAELGGWRSVASYYTQSSFGTAKFEGKVAQSWMIWDGKETSSDCSGVNAANKGVEWYKAEYAKEGHGALGEDAEPISYFDANQDGYVDLVWIVYSHPTTTSGDWWAYVTYTSNKAGTPTNPVAKTLGYASIDWMESKFNGFDAHTYIHETGHTFGLDDYYCYNNAWSPFGKIDMMDSNIGDHNAYSKFSLGWLKPLVVDDSALITLRSTSLTGDCFIVPSQNYNGTAFDEYLMFEFITPEGLNEQDYKVTYQGVPGYSNPAIRVSHVDARVYNNVSTRDSYLVDNPEEGFDVRLGNSRGGRMSIKTDGDYWPDAQGSTTGKYMAHLSLIESSIDATKNVLTDSNYVASNGSLFKEGDRLSFTSGKWAEVFMPSGTNLWNKAKTITSWKGNAQNFTVDNTMSINYSFRVVNVERVDGEWYAQVRVTKTA